MTRQTTPQTTPRSAASKQQQRLAAPATARAPTGSVLALQRAIGNRAVTRLVQGPRTAGAAPLMIQRNPAKELIKTHTAVGGLDKAALAKDLIGRTAKGELAFVHQVLDELEPKDRDAVTATMALSVGGTVAKSLKKSEEGSRLLARLMGEEGGPSLSNAPPAAAAPPQSAAAAAPRGGDWTVPRGSAAVAPRGSAAVAPRGSAAVAPRGSAAVAPRGAAAPPQSTSAAAPRSNAWGAPRGGTAAPPPSTTAAAPPQSASAVAPRSNAWGAPRGGAAAPPQSTAAAPAQGASAAAPRGNAWGAPSGTAAAPPASIAAAAKRAAPLAPKAPKVTAQAFQDAPLGDRLGSGGEKEVYAVAGNDNIVIGILRSDDVTLLEAEIALLSKLKAADVPTVSVLGITTHRGSPAIVMERMATGSKNIVNSKKGRVEIVGESELLNARSIQDLTLIRKRMRKAQIRVHDLQFLIGRDGRVVVADPVDVLLDTAPSETNLQTIDQLIEAAQRNLRK